MVTIKRIDSFEYIGNNAWNALLGSSRENYIFQSYEFLSTWWKHFGESNKKKELLLLIAIEDGVIVGIAPLMADTVRVLGKPVIGFIGTPICDYMDFIAVKGKEKEVASSFFGYLRTLRCLSINLKFVPEGGMAIGHADTRVIIDACPFIELGPTWESTYNGLNRSIKKYVERRQRLIAEVGELQLGFVKEEAEIDGFLEKYFAIHVSRWRDYGKRYSQFQFAFWRDFMRDIAHLFFSKGNMDISYLKINSQIIAAHVGFIYGKRFLWYMPTHNVNYSRFSPGNLFILELLKDLQHRGIIRFDFLRGLEPYKVFWTDKKTNLFECISYPDRLFLRKAGQFLKLADDIYLKYIKEKLRRFSPLMRLWYRSKNIESGERQ